MKANLKILILEDNQSDADLLYRELKRSGMNFISEIVQTREEYENALQNFSPNIILSDYSLPSFDADAAFRIKQIRSPQIPFIIVSGIIGEEKAVELIKNGVTDFTPKDKLFTLSQKIIRALKESEEWNEKIFIAEKLKMQAADLIIANKELVFQNQEKEKRAFELTLANIELKKAEESQKEYILGLEEMIFITSHKVRQPITQIQGISNLLEGNTNTQDEIEEIIGYLKEPIQSLDTLTRELTVYICKLQYKLKCNTEEED